MVKRDWTARCTIVAVLAAGAAAPAAGGERTSRCWKRGVTVLANQDARVYTAVDVNEEEVWGCFRRRGSRAMNLGSFGPTNGITDVQLAGRFAGFVIHGAGCSRGTCMGDQVALADLRKGTQRWFPGRAFVLTNRGSLALLRDEPDGRIAVIAIDRGGTRTLDAGAIDPGSLARGGRRVYWLNAGEPRTALLDE